MFSLSEKDGANVLIYSFDVTSILENRLLKWDFFNFPLPLRPLSSMSRDRVSAEKYESRLSISLALSYSAINREDTHAR